LPWFSVPHGKKLVAVGRQSKNYQKVNPATIQSIKLIVALNSCLPIAISVRQLAALIAEILFNKCASCRVRGTTVRGSAGGLPPHSRRNGDGVASAWGPQPGRWLLLSHALQETDSVLDLRMVIGTAIADIISDVPRLVARAARLRELLGRPKLVLKRELPKS
jgi:hypothetical protein